MTGVTTGQVTACSGCSVRIPSPDPANGQRVLQECRTRSGQDAVALLVRGLPRRADLRRLGLEIRIRYPGLDVLAIKASGWCSDRCTTADGVDSTFAFTWPLSC
ncbi:hypothetical protein [Deinococcus navajonensis]|uniref:Uncharacterized protein n=1 Tax=Deinococcus navajonensis TaxID=309884 RepID=A0ABV8XH91_9DEIO